MSNRHRNRGGSVAAAVCATLLALAAAQPATAQEKLQVDIPAQEMSQALMQFGRQIGTEILFEPDVVRGKRVQAVKGALHRDEVLKQLLSGSGLKFRETDQGAIVIESNKTVEEVVVTGAYEHEATSVGPLGARKLKDTPFSLGVMSGEMLENIHASSADDLLRLNPMLRTFGTSSRAGAGAANMTIRGFSMSSANGTAENGLRTQKDSVFMEEMERVEVLTGLSGFLYGPASVGGLVNYVTKRPPDASLLSVTAGSYGGSNLFAHGDVGGRFGANDQFGYRINALLQDGDTVVDEQSNRRELLSLAADWRITSDLVLQLNASSGDSVLKGSVPAWQVPVGVPYPRPQEPTDNYGQPFAGTEVDTDKVGASLHWRINDTFQFRASYRHAEDYVSWPYYVNNTYVPASGTYSQAIYSLRPSTSYRDAVSLLLDADFLTGPLRHKMTAGFFGDRSVTKEEAGPYFGLALTRTGLDYFAPPTYIDAPAQPALGGGALIRTSRRTARNFVIGDEISYGEHWSLLLGANHSTPISTTYDSITGAQGVTYQESEVSPSVSLLYKPKSFVTTYVSYVEALEPGVIVTNSGTQTYTNAGTALPPLVSEQFEVGAKLEWREALFTLALFDIDRGLQYALLNPDSTYTYVQSGRQTHKGVEFSVNGRVAERLFLYGGFTFLDPKVSRNEANPALNGKAPQIVSKEMAKLYAEYEPAFVPGLALTAGIAYTGRYAANTLNSVFLPSFTTGDVGARYSMRWNEDEITFRLTVANVTNERYWLTNSYVGAPRSVALSVQFKK